MLCANTSPETAGPLFEITGVEGSHADDGAADRTAVMASAAASEAFALRCLDEMTQTTLVSETSSRLRGHADA